MEQAKQVEQERQAEHRHHADGGKAEERDEEQPWKKWSQEEVDRQMSPSQWSHRLSPDAVIKAHCAVLRTETDEGRRLCAEYKRHVYGDEAKGEVIDAYYPKGGHPRCSVLYFHGGMWQALSIDDSGFAAGPLVEKGFALFAPEYTIAPKGDMDLMVDQCARSVVHTLQHTSCPLIIAGHSAGGHLAVQMQWVDWSKYGLTEGDIFRIEGIFSVSGLLDLGPVQACYANEALNLTDEQVQKYSPLRLIQKTPHPTLPCQVVLAIAEHEPDEFRRHSQAYARIMQQHHMPVALMEVVAVDHFDCIENLHQRDYELTKRLLQLAVAARSSRHSSVSSLP